jgi:nicotinate-nucleotide pyrophosphorylase (carboxylating)
MMGPSDEVESVRLAVSRALEAAPPGVEVQVEVTSLAAALEAGRCGAHKILLDNMTPEEMAGTVKALEERFGVHRPETEASGGITLESIREVAATGIDRISVGALTHSAPALDIAMYIGFD